MNSIGASSVANSDIGPGIADQDCQKTFINIIPNQDTRTGTDQLQESPISDSDELCEVTECCVDNYEFENEGINVSNSPGNPKGNLKKHLSFWREIGTSQFILNVIEEGYRLPFTSIPQPAILKNNRSAEKHKSFVDEAVAELLQSGRIVETVGRPHVLNPLSVSVQPNGKKRLILDLRYVNNYLDKLRIKYEDWKVAMLYFERNAYMFSFDLKSGYHHVEIFQHHQTYLGFVWKCPQSQRDKFYVFTVLPFGLSVAPYVFTKLLKPLEKRWRHLGICIAIFLDDGWSVEKDLLLCRTNSRRVRQDLLHAGFIPNDEKSIWDPTQIIEWLGLQWNALKGTLSIVRRRLDKIINTIESIIVFNFVISARELAAFVGQIISTGAVIGNIARIMTRHCSMSVASAASWDGRFPLDEFCKHEIWFWKRNIFQVNERDCFLYHKPSRFIYSDASKTGCGSLITLNGGAICHKMWDDAERCKSATWRELAAIEFSLRSFVQLLKSAHVKWYTDNRTVATIVGVGSMKLDLQKIAIDIFQFCINNNISIDIQWIPREQNVRADFISRLIDPDDWQITKEFFNQLDNLWGPHTVDCFANYYNRKLTRYFSRYWNPETSGVDFFVQALGDENCLAVPPVSIIARSLHYFKHQQAKVTLVIPHWPSANYWPLVTCIYKTFVVGYKIFDGQKVLKHGRNTKSLLGSKRFIGDVIAVRFIFTDTSDKAPKASEVLTHGTGQNSDNEGTGKS